MYLFDDEDRYLGIGHIPTNTPGYGLQSEDAAVPYLGDTINGAVSFTSSQYWDDGNGNLLSPYNANGASYDGNPYPYVYDNTYVTAPNFENDGYNTSGYSIAYYVEQYKARLLEMGAPSSIIGRLLSYEEAQDAIDIEVDGTSIIYDGQSYWLGSTNSGVSFHHDYNTFFVGSISEICSSECSTYNDNDYMGVRPVIEIPTSELQ